jgi:tRNA dimethylallyltransferase
MFSPAFRDSLILTGPTGSGKTQLGIALAERMDAEIISMDSMAVYRGMDVGTAKPSVEERRRVKHHLIDELEPWESASVAWWLTRAEHSAREIAARGKQVLFVGGTAMYLKALLRGLFEGPARDESLRRRLELEAQTLGTEGLHERLTQADPEAARRIHRRDLRRIIRALEVWELTGKPISAWQTQWRESGEDPISPIGPIGPIGPIEHTEAVWLDIPRPKLYERINRRVEGMFAAGFIDEARALRRLPQQLTREATQALGYKEVFAHLDGQASLEDTLALVQMRSRQYAKRQITWFRHLPECRPASSQLTWDLWSDKMK